jgi:hypothetical protein
MYLGLLIKKGQPFANNSWRIATPVLGFLSGNCRVAPITLRVIGAASFLPVYLCVSCSEVLLMASNSSYLVLKRSAIYTIFMRCLLPVSV